MIRVQITVDCIDAKVATTVDAQFKLDQLFQTKGVAGVSASWTAYSDEEWEITETTT